MNNQEIDDLAREIYHQRTKSPIPMTDERWTSIKKRFKQSVSICRDEALRMIDDDESIWDD